MKFRMHFHLASLCNNPTVYAIIFSVHHVEYGRFIPKAPKDAISYVLFKFSLPVMLICCLCMARLFFVCGADDIDVIFHFCNVLFDCRTEEKHHYTKRACVQTV